MIDVNNIRNFFAKMEKRSDPKELRKYTTITDDLLQKLLYIYKKPRCVCLKLKYFVIK